MQDIDGFDPQEFERDLAEFFGTMTEMEMDGRIKKDDADSFRSRHGFDRYND